jgi:hypothetical protein
VGAVTTQRTQPSYRPRTSAGGPARRPQAAAGLTAVGVLVIVFVGSLVGLLAGAFTSGSIGWMFGICFVAITAYTSFQVRRRDIAAALIVPPLVFAVLVIAYEFFSQSGSAIDRFAFGLNEILDAAPTLWIATGVAVVIVAYRIWRERRA